MSADNLLVSPESYFAEVVREALHYRKLESFPLAENYLVQLLKQYLNVDNLFKFSEEKGKRQRETLAELYLRALSSEKRVKFELLRELGDTSLYVGGFFGDSLRRKIIDIGYYVDMGEMAYERLAYEVEDDMIAKVYSNFSEKFKSYMDALTYISQKSVIQSSEDILRLYERYISTGSELAKDQLMEKGILNIPKKKPYKQ